MLRDKKIVFKINVFFRIPEKGTFSYNNAVVFDGTGFLFFGGYDGDMAKSMNDIYHLSSPSFVWKKVGELNFARYGHS